MMAEKKADPGRVISRLLLIVALLFWVAGCSEQPEKESDVVEERQVQQPAVLEPGFVSLLPAEASALLAKDKRVLVVDVRGKDERRRVRIPNSVAVPFREILAGRVTLPKDRPLLLICGIGGRSYVAGLSLAEHGYSFLYNLRGGISGWEQAGLPVEHGDGASAGQ